MRNERWVNRFLFAWNDTLFFDPLESHYEPRKDHFLTTLDDRVRARFLRHGIWWSHRLNPSLPDQGWKIHVSANHRNVREVAASALAYLTAHEVDFKIALDLNIFEMLSSKAMSRGSGGKFITVYPRDVDEFRKVLSDLDGILEGAEGPYVLSDMRYRDNKALYFRYGQLLPTDSVDALGRRMPHIVSPDGPVADDRRPVYSQPWWEPWPFDDWKPADETEDEELLDGRFRVTGALQFSNSGGVYTAEDTAHGDRQVVLKEARPHTNVNPRRDHDAVDILAREWTFLNRLSDVGSYPAPIATFRHWEHAYIAEEFVDGSDIRSVLLEHNPLARPGFDIEKSRHFLRMYLTVFRGLARAIHAAHERGVILGDFTAANLLIDPDTYEVTIVDLEACRLSETGAGGEEGEEELEKPVELFTPGFSLSRSLFEKHGTEGDLFGLATTMAYFVFPIAAMSHLRTDVLDAYRIFTDKLCWPARIHELITGLAAARIGLPEIVEELADQESLLAQVRAAPPRKPVVTGDPGLLDAERGVAAFVEAVADPTLPTLFPVDPFAHISNPLSLGFGASGVLWALHASGVPIRPEWRGWLDDRLSDLDVSGYPDGLMSGLSGIAWAADSLGLKAHARELLAQANARASEGDDYTFYYGLAGLGMTNLRFFLRSRDPRDLAAARKSADALQATVRREGDHAYWLNDFTKDDPFTGLGFGQAGVAMFLLRMHQVTGEERWLKLGRAALAWEMAHVKPLEDGLVMFEHEGTLEPYVEVGSAGVAQVLLRYGDTDAARTILRGLDIRQSVLAGYTFGLSGVADALLDAAEATGDTTYRDTALRQLDFVRQVFLFEPAERFALPRPEGVTLLGVPGEGLLRCACDYSTGSAGVLRALHRANHGGGGDFLLDEVAS
ncbi:class III lanthionine synthetase LanKC [Streptomyces sp. DSM 42041]|uniref:Class III lanthionine synthetase LanKC n=1 Tax=Streptomyces hazeniae TaxID=3075538 RepID=A0ABU2NQJ3_9ACTN|nr:class III lanthionine synthetase LanKC [Streptomyces sp. DSM 42041]MDT0378302.1 class III lanthionine synthetase LanKC [Streptomyces sp. DSM 42041]